MSELIERKKAMKNICKYCSEPKCKENECMVFAGIKDTPTAEPEVRHGEWIIKPHGSYGQMRAFCSACGKHSGIGGIESNQRKPFCPNCGARMDADHIADASKKVGGVDNG